MRTQTVRIAVAGDIHLGKRQYNNSQREKDFQDAWLWVCSVAASKSPDFFVLTGDLFDKKTVDPVPLSCAIHGLSSPGLGMVLAIEGNHDGRSFIQRGRSWIEYLSDQGYIDHVLRLNTPYMDDDGVFFCGSPWAGRSTGAALGGMAWDAEIGARNDDFKVGVMHAAPEGYVPGAGGVSVSEIDGSGLDMLLMGHCHRPFNVSNKALCAGSPEICDIGEIGEPGGLWIIDIDLHTKGTTAEFLKYEPRPFIRLSLDSSDITSDGTREVKYDFGNPPFATKAVVIVDVVGDRVFVDVPTLQKVAQGVFSPLLVRVNDKMDAKPDARSKTSGPESFRKAVEPLLGDVSFDEFGAVFDCYERQDGDARSIVKILEGSNDKKCYII